MRMPLVLNEIGKFLNNGPNGTVHGQKHAHGRFIGNPIGKNFHQSAPAHILDVS